jgi:hypothetical protein
MIAFQQLMVICIKKEYEFFFLIANQLNIEKGGLMIYFIKNSKLPIKNEFQRIQQFYRLAPDAS